VVLNHTRFRLQWQESDPVKRFRSGVSLHSHTHHSKESLGFLYRVAARVGFIDAALKRGRRRHGSSFDLNRGWWTPPLVPLAALDLEREHIESELGLQALVSLTDHDSIEAPLSLRPLEHCRELPISVEWTVPFGSTFLHLGVHNLPARTARHAMREMEEFTAVPQSGRLHDLLENISADPATLVVLNHPLWDENEMGAAGHESAVDGFMRCHSAAVHALEVNGLRPWSENSQVGQLARAWSKPLVAGGDRHGLEPNTVLNLTSAGTFAEFVEEVRQEGRSDILITRQYRQSLFWRTFETVLDAVGDHERHGLGWRSWDDRVFYLCDDGRTRSLKQIWGNRAPGLVRQFTTIARALHRSRLQKTIRAAMARPQEVAL
jgi:hypothetical protein